MLRGTQSPGVRAAKTETHLRPSFRVQRSAAGPAHASRPPAAPRGPLPRQPRPSTRLNATASSELPGPFSIPGLGSVGVLLNMLRGKPFQHTLAALRAKYGPIFLIKTGPVQQVWIGDPELLRIVYDIPECSGRPASFEDPFGNFLFLTKQPEVAAPIREAQKAWLVANLQSEAVGAAAEAALAKRVLPVLAAAGGAPLAWPEDAIRTAMYGAVTTTILGEAGLATDDELNRLMAAVRTYSEMRGKAKSGQADLDAKELPPGAADIRDIVLASLERSGRSDAAAALPLVVAASVGGAEIFPTLLHWVCLFLANNPERQAAAAALADRRDDAGLMTELYCALRRTPYSVALGPPRKVLGDVEFRGMRIPEGALLFAMHPAIADAALGRAAPPPGEDDFRSYAFGAGRRSCLGQGLTEALMPAAVGTLLRSFRISAAGADAAAPKGELKGQLIRPMGTPTLVWTPRTPPS